MGKKSESRTKNEVDPGRGKRGRRRREARRRWVEKRKKESYEKKKTT